MDRTLKQKFRQPFGFYMENLIGRHLTTKGIFTMYHAHSYAFEWGLDLNDEDLNQLKFLINILEINTGELSERVRLVLKGNNGYYNQTYAELIRRNFSFKDNKKLFNKKIILLAVSDLISSNILELLRIEDHRLIVSEVKSQYGPKVDYRIEFERSQLNRLLTLTNTGIETSLIYCIALPAPRFVEIPFIKLYEEFTKYTDFNGREFTTDNWADLRIKIPLEYRKDEKFERIHESLYSFKDEKSLYKSILDAFPGKFSRLEKFLNLF
ncbi:hypothetical protein [Thermoplasma acidophilum]|uniref:Uncharacterized protein n=1 Tax=Thermoplasma acidophilum (strain ATCC 25905 / DSM 1728 / JCM 9062 / NBRC 15155 / AMRC-C165) TaxID=273075 RepID=Q9HIF4_THEAC|nr:hypothetical protein [Thermoplasma acidophilum]CAC12506.1 hypothetical protein [Thermoplasma acidophilum]